MKVAKAHKCSSILASFITKLPFDIVKEHLPFMILQVKDSLNVVPLIESIETIFGGDDQEKVAELLYLILKPKFEPSNDPDNLEQSKRESETYVKRLT